MYSSGFQALYDPKDNNCRGRSQEQAKEVLARMSPQGRVLQPVEVAHLVATLVSEHARGIHGQALVIDGGQICH